MALKRSKPKTDGTQLDLFSYDKSNTGHIDAVRNHGRGPLAEVLPEHGQELGSERQTSGDVARSGGQDRQRDVRPDHAGDETRIDGATSARPGLGNREGEIHLPAAR